MEELRRRVALHGPPKFECPEDFTAVPFAPGPPFSPEMLRDPTKQLLLIRAPADFSPESLNDHVVPLSGLQTLKVLQPDSTHKVYSIQTTPGESGSCAHLLIPSDRQGQIACAPPFAGSLTIWERFGDPNTHQILLPVAHRLAPQIPDGLRQRFLPFGGQQKRPLPSPSSLGDAEMPPQKKKKKKKKQRRLHPEEQQSPEVSFGELATPLEMGVTSPQLKEEVQEEEQAVAEGGGRGPCLPGAAKELPERETQAIRSLEASSQESFFSAKAEELSHGTKKRRKKKKHTEAVAENKDSLLDLSSVSQQAEEDSQVQLELQLERNGEMGLEGLVQRKHKKKKKHREEAEEKGEAMTQTDLTSLKEEAGGDPWEGNGLGNVVEGSLGLTEGGPGGELPDHKSKRKKKKKEKMGVEEGEEGQPLGQEAGSLWSEPIAVKQEQKGWVEVDAASGQGTEGNGSLELGLEVPTHKHKKKKKKKEQESKDP